jgi:hypothetical protein
MSGYYIDLDRGPSHWPLWKRLVRAYRLADSLREPDEDFPEGIPFRTTWQAAWIVWGKCACGKCDKFGPWGKRAA